MEQGSPEWLALRCDAVRFVVGGTNGKGSVARMVTELLVASGLSVSSIGLEINSAEFWIVPILRMMPFNCVIMRPSSMLSRSTRPSVKTTSRRHPSSIDRSHPTSRTCHLDLQRHRGPPSAPGRRWTCRRRAATRCQTVGPSWWVNCKPVA